MFSPGRSPPLHIRGECWWRWRILNSLSLFLHLSLLVSPLIRQLLSRILFAFAADYGSVIPYLPVFAAYCRLSLSQLFQLQFKSVRLPRLSLSPVSPQVVRSEEKKATDRNKRKGMIPLFCSSCFSMNTVKVKACQVMNVVLNDYAFPL